MTTTSAMTAVMLLAGVAAFGGLRLWRLAVPPAPDVAGGVRRWEQARSRASMQATRPQTRTAPRDPGERLARWAAYQLRTRRVGQLGGFERDLAMVGTTMEAWLTKTLLVAAAGFAVPFAALVFFSVLGFRLPYLLAPGAGLVLASVMVVASVAETREKAARYREDLRWALSAVMDMVVMSMEAGRGHGEALPAAAGIGTGWEFTQLHDAISGARSYGITPWEALGRLGERYGIRELTELRAAMNLAQDEGSRIRSTLIALAASMRAARTAEKQARGNAATETMRTTLVLLGILGALYVITPRLLFLFTQ